MALWGHESAATYGHWSTTNSYYAASGYGPPPSPPRSPSPPPFQAASYNTSYYNSQHQTNGMGATTYGQEPQYNYNKKHQTHGMGAITYGQEDYSYNKKTQSHGMGAVNHGHQGLFGELLPTSFPPGTDPKVVQYFKNVDRDGNGFIDEKELKTALSSYSSTFSLRTVRIIMYSFARSNTKVIGPKEFAAVYSGLQQFKTMFQKFDRDRNGKIDRSELREALRGLGYPVSEIVLDSLILKFDKNGGNSMVIGFDGFIECCLTVKGLTDKFKENDRMLSGSATFTYETFMKAVLPFIVA